MYDLKEGLQNVFGVDVAIDDENESLPIKQQAIYVASMDFVEYVSRDATLVSDRIDDFLTLHWNRDQTELLGFKLKGFRNYFETVLKPELSDQDFIPLVRALEEHVTHVGRQMFPSTASDPRVVQAYRAAKALAERDDVRLAGSSLLAA